MLAGLLALDAHNDEPVRGGPREAHPVPSGSEGGKKELGMEDGGRKKWLEGVRKELVSET